MVIGSEQKERLNDLSDFNAADDEFEHINSKDLETDSVKEENKYSGFNSNNKLNIPVNPSPAPKSAGLVQSNKIF